MDGAAIALARDNRIPVIVFAIGEPGILQAVLAGTARATDRARVSCIVRTSGRRGRRVARECIMAQTFDIKDLERRMRAGIEP